MLFTIDSLKEIFPDYQGGNHQEHIDEIMVDSRKQTSNGLFVPIVGDRFNAHDFIEGAIQEGAIASLWDKQYDIPAELTDRCYFFCVDDTLEALQTLARAYREKVNPTVIAITGSNGKTTTKDIIAALLETTYQTHKTAGNFNNHIGLPLTILSMPETSEMLVLEMGMNDFGEIDLLSRLATPDYAIVTNVGESHIEYLGSRAGIAKAKLEIINGLSEKGSLVIDGDEALLQSLDIKQEVLPCGFEKRSEETVLISDVEVKLDATSFILENRAYEIPLTGAHHAKNAAYAIVLARMLGVSEANIKKGLTRIHYSEMRFETIAHHSGATLINDAYNASPTSMIAAVNVVKQLTNYKQKIVVLGDVFELGERAEQFHAQIGRAITEPIKLVFTIGNNAKIISDTIQASNKKLLSEHCVSEEELIEKLEPYLNEETIVLFKASRGMAFENIINKLIDK
ncbi:MAG TPA: UDP-N-acetylmuramoyl-tripeptide--D-alanyl-D-alanine ligase [Pseudogracilibacillus sp.]|nr:UDP-N-acetylmuramoyl-tripeptide--D-alanyl-D-alanine ligase [Pseudogracilibacillus sp.]